jgi:protein-tyrosine phosphatase
VTKRRVTLDGPVNFRDLGGYETADGRTVRWGRVFRSDSLHHLTEADGPRLAKIGIATALDFRAHDELDRIGIGRLGGLDIRHVHVPTVDQALHTVRHPDWEPPDSVAEIYLMMMKTGARAYNAALRTLADPGTLPAVYFCMAGKDRTGVFSAVLLGLLGVSEQDIVDDYVLTHEVVETIHERGRIERGPTTAEEDAFWEALPSELRGAHASTMEGMVAAVPGLFGSWEGYAEFIGVGDDVVSTLRELLLEGDAA